MPFALLVPEAVEYRNESLPGASWDEYAVDAGLYLFEPVRLIYGWHGVTVVPVPAGERPQYLRVSVPATLVRSYRQRRFLWRVTGQTTHPMTEVSLVRDLYPAHVEVGVPGLFAGTRIVEHHGCEECGAAPGEKCREFNCQGTWV